MGQSASDLRDQNKKFENERERQIIEERIKILEKMVENHLEKVHQLILAGHLGDQEIQCGTVLSHFKQVNLKLEEEGSPDLDESIDEFFKKNFMKGLSKLLDLDVREVLGNSSVGEHESSSMFIVWKDNALIRCDVYTYRWNFTSKGVIEKVEGVVGLMMIQRVIDITKIDSQVFTCSITRQAEKLGVKAKKMIDEAFAALERVKDYQKQLKNIVDDGELPDTPDS